MVLQKLGVRSTQSKPKQEVDEDPVSPLGRKRARTTDPKETAEDLRGTLRKRQSRRIAIGTVTTPWAGVEL